MTFEVIWLEQAQQEVRVLWEDDSLRGPLSQAVRTIDQWLGTMPLTSVNRKSDCRGACSFGRSS